MTPFTSVRVVLPIIVVSGLSGVMADNGDDFSNNLFSDLTPLLALFGEQFAKQFMSESMTWLDHIIFAMAPLGILTALVGAIRVGGPSWLKAVIGRARENRAAAEVELMSSTSHEVCELWNGQAIVRTLGKPRIQELIYLKEWRNEGEFGLYTLKGAKEKGCLKNKPHKGPLVSLFETFLWRNRERLVHGEKPRDRPDEEQGPQSPPLDEGKPQLRDGLQLEDAPNISLNLHRGSKAQDLFFAAISGILLQAGVLIYSGLTTYYPSLRSKLKRNDQTGKDYAFPVMTVGTMVLAFGMMMCSFIIEHSTVEERWVARSISPVSSLDRPAKSTKSVARVLWLQKSHVVSDQSFDSYVIFAGGTRNEILTSRRLLSSALDQSVLGEIASRPFEALTLLGTLAGISGFVLQFEGLRGMHWTVTIAQLVAIFIMAILRAWVRRGMTTLPRDEKVLHDHEMDWLALGIAMEPDFWIEYSGPRSQLEGGESEAQLRDPSEDPEESRVWKIRTSASNFACRGHWYKPPYPIEPATDAERAVKVRRRLGQLTKWTGPASKPAISVAAAIAIVMKTFFESASGEKKRWWGDLNEQSEKTSQPTMETQRFVWTLKASIGSKDQDVSFTVRTTDKGVWEADATEIEAALSLWIFHIQKSDRGQRREGKDESVDWLQSEDAVLKERYHRVLGPKTNALQRDLAWWISDEIIQDVAEAFSPKNGHVGFIGIKPITPNSDRQFMSPDSLMVVSNTTLELLFAQHMFSAFMWAIADKIPVELFGDQTTVNRKGASGPTALQSAKLENTTLSEMTRDIQRTGLGTLEEVFMCVVPPLSLEKKLPVEAMVDFVRENVKDHEVNSNWEEAEQAYLQLILMCKAIGSEDQFTYKALAVTIEFLRLVSELLMAERCLENGGRSVSLKKMESGLVTEMRGSRLRHAIADLREIYTKQSRVEAFQGLFEKLQEGVSATSELSPDRLSMLFRHTPLHRAIISDESLPDGMDKYTQMKDTFDWTPLHYAVVKSKESLARILKRGVNINAKDIAEWTPLHYAAFLGREASVVVLLESGAQIGSRGRDGMSPLHCAAKAGNVETVALLLKWDADIKALDNWRRAALHLAAAGGHQSVARLLLENGATATAADRWGATPLLWAAGSGHEAVAQLLLDEGADIAAKSNSGETALHRAVANGHEKVIRLLLDKGANPSAEGESGETTLQRAAVTGNGVAMSLLESTSVRDGGGVRLINLINPPWKIDTSPGLTAATGVPRGNGLLPNCSIAATTWHDHCRVYFQDVLGGVREAKYEDQAWSGGDEKCVLFKAKLYTPLAAINWGDGQQIHIYYMSEQNILQEYYYSAATGWSHGDLNDLKVQLDPYSRIHAIEWSYGSRIRLYCQEFTSNAIQEYYREHSWVKGETLPTPFNTLRGTSLTSAYWVDDGELHIRLYYQDIELNIREICFDKKWRGGAFAPGTAPSHTSITAFGRRTRNLWLRVYWQDDSKDLVELRWDKEWNYHPRKVITGAKDQMCFFSAPKGPKAYTSDIFHTMVFFQGAANELLEESFSEDTRLGGAVVAI